MKPSQALRTGTDAAARCLSRCTSRRLQSQGCPFVDARGQGGRPQEKKRWPADRISESAMRRARKTLRAARKAFLATLITNAKKGSTER